MQTKVDLQVTTKLTNYLDIQNETSRRTLKFQ